MTYLVTRVSGNIKLVFVYAEESCVPGRKMSRILRRPRIFFISDIQVGCVLRQFSFLTIPVRNQATWYSR